mgnify:CR=1 FL=1
MTKWTKDLATERGWYLTAYRCNLCDGNPHWVFDARMLGAGENVNERLWRSVDPITPPSEEKQ